MFVHDEVTYDKVSVEKRVEVSKIGVATELSFIKRHN
jgi:hypothetical protein